MKEVDHLIRRLIEATAYETESNVLLVPEIVSEVIAYLSRDTGGPDRDYTRRLEAVADLARALLKEQGLKADLLRDWKNHNVNLVVSERIFVRLIDAVAALNEEC